MALKILRPNSVGRYATHWTSNNGNPFWANLNEADSDGDVAYIHTTQPGAFTVGFSNTSSGSYIRPTRTGSATIIATIRVNGALPTKFKFRLRHLGTDYDSEEITISSNTYIEVAQTYFQEPNGVAWNATSLNGLEVGLVYIEGSELRCTKLEIQVHTELYPHQTLEVDGINAAFQDWHNHPGTASAHMSVGAFDGDASYIYSSTAWRVLDTRITTSLRDVWGFPTGEIFAVGDGGTVLHWDGTEWDPNISNIDENLYAVWGSSPTDVFAVGTLGQIIHWDGLEWSTMTSGTVLELRGVWGSASNNVFAVGRNGTILQYNGVAWAPMASGSLQDLYDIWGADANNVFVVGDTGESLYYNGAVWAPLISGTIRDLHGVWGTAANDVYAVGFAGTILHYNGAVWAPMVSGTVEFLRDVWGDTSTDIVAVGENGLVLRWDGVVWQERPSHRTEHLDGIWGTLATHIYIVGEDGISLAYEEDTWIPVSVFTLSNFVTPTYPPNIDRVQTSCLVKNIGDTSGRAAVIARSAGVNYQGAHGVDGWEIPADGVWHLIEEEFINDPSTGWPSGLPGYTPWNSAEVDLLELGIINLDGNLRATTIAAEVFQKNVPITLFDMLPIADGFHRDYTVSVPPQVPGTYWQNVDEVPPDYAASYLGADVSLAGTTQYGTFVVGPPIGAFPAGEQAYTVQVRLIVQLGVTTSALVAPLIRSAGETYVGKTIPIDNTGVNWFELREEFFTSPFSGAPWTAVEIDSAEYGMVVLEGDVLLTQVRVQTQTAPLLSGVPGPVDLRLTDLADAPAPVGYIDRSKADGTIYAITEFAVGSGGFVPATPTSVVPVNTADTALINEVYRARIAKITYDTTNYPVDPWEVTYWCRVPPEVAIAPIGELGLFAEIIWSPIPAEIGTKFLFALLHMPCQCRHKQTAHFYQVTIEYP